jgi:hypothetical protein
MSALRGAESEKSWRCPSAPGECFITPMQAWMLLTHGKGRRPETLTQDQETAVLYTHYDYSTCYPGHPRRIEAAYHIKQRFNGDAVTRCSCA